MTEEILPRIYYRRAKRLDSHIIEEYEIAVHGYTLEECEKVFDIFDRKWKE